MTARRPRATAPKPEETEPQEQSPDGAQEPAQAPEPTVVADEHLAYSSYAQGYHGESAEDLGNVPRAEDVASFADHVEIDRGVTVEHGDEGLTTIAKPSSD
jgi:hypothetical protein